MVWGSTPTNTYALELESESLPINPFAEANLKYVCYWYQNHYSVVPKLSLPSDKVLERVKVMCWELLTFDEIPEIVT